MKQDHDMMPPSSSQSLGRYRVLRRIGKGGMGDVWLAEDPSLHRQVAIKTLPTHSQNDREFALRFAHEAQAAAALNHPHILSIHDFGEQPLSHGQSTTYIVMPYISGGSLADKIIGYTASNTRMPEQEAIFYLQQAAEAIDYAHSQGVVHRDIKPGNMLLRPDNWLLLADFGIARMLASQEQMTQAGVGIGTPEYMAPEQAQGKAEAASDNYSLAVIAYQLFTGHLPFIGDTGYAITIQHILTPPPSPHEYNPSLSLAFETVLLQGLAKKPQQRPSSAQAFVAELQRTLINAAFEPTYVKSQVPATLIVPTSTPNGRELQPETSGNNGGVTKLQKKQTGITRRQVLLGGGAVGILTLGGVAWIATSHSHTPFGGQSTPVAGNTTATPSPGDPTLLLLGHNQPVTSLGWSPKANTLVSAGAEGSIFAWDVEALAQQKRQPLLPLAKQVFSANDKLFVAWSPDGNTVAIANAGADLNANTSSIYVYQKDLRGPIQGYEKPILVPGVLDVDGLGWTTNQYIVTLDMPADFIGKSQFHLRLWDTTQPSLQLQPALLSGDLSVSFTSNMKRLSTSPKKNTLVAIALDAGAMVGEVGVSGKVVKWQQRSDILPIMKSSFAQEVDGIGWLSSGNYIVGFNQGVGRSIINGWQWQQKNPTPSAVTLPDDDPILTTLAICTAPTSALIAAGGKKGTVYIWHVGKGTEPVQVLHGDKASNAAVGALEWSADGKWLAASYQDVHASILVWDVTALNV